MARIPALSLFLSVAGALVAQAQPAPLPSLADATRIVDAADGAELGWPEFAERLAAFDALFVGETHLDDTTHRVELQILEEALRVRDGKVVLSMEMFERDVQPTLDAYLAGKIPEAEFLAKARPWGNYESDYRPMVELAKARGIPVIAANFPAMLRRKLGMGGKAAVDKLGDAERAYMPERILPASEAYWARVDRATRGHMGGGGQSPEERLYDGQNLWDNAMGDAVAKALVAHPGNLVVHVAGGFHTAYKDGTVAQFAARAAGAKFATVAIAAASAMHKAQPERDADEADYLIYAQAIARHEFEGRFAVTVASELRYLLHVPDGVAMHAGHKAPLLVWVPDADEDPEDALAYWRNSIGDGAAVAVVEHAFPQPAADLGKGGRWQSGDGFRADYGAVTGGLEQLVEYAARRLPIDGERVLIAGKGEGGAVVMWASLYSSWLRASMLALEPADLVRLSMEALPDKAPTMRRLCVTASPSLQKRVDKAVADYVGIGAAAEAKASMDGSELAAWVRAELGLGGLAAVRAPGEPHHVVLERELPRARQWAEIFAAQLRQRGHEALVHGPGDAPAGVPAERLHRMALGGPDGWAAELVANGNALPLAGGSFGGTTLVVLPVGASDQDFAGWQGIEASKVIKRRSMFANLAVARQDQAPLLPDVVAELKRRGRSRLLIVPGVFCASADEMQALRRLLGDAADGMDLHWLPGLGSSLVRM